MCIGASNKCKNKRKIKHWEIFSKLLAHWETYDCRRLFSLNISLFQIKRNVWALTRSWKRCILNFLRFWYCSSWTLWLLLRILYNFICYNWCFCLESSFKRIYGSWKTKGIKKLLGKCKNSEVDIDFTAPYFRWWRLRYKVISRE